jgi:hypothetical protein
VGRQGIGSEGSGKVGGEDKRKVNWGNDIPAIEIHPKDSAINISKLGWIHSGFD